MPLDTEPGVLDATIQANASDSDDIDLGFERLHRIEMPAGWTAASLTLWTKSAAGVWGPVYTATGEYVITATGVGRHIVVDPAVAFGLQHVRLRSGTQLAAVQQAQQRILKLVTQPA